jgi:hypothetical protein
MFGSDGVGARRCGALGSWTKRAVGQCPRHRATPRTHNAQQSIIAKCSRTIWKNLPSRASSDNGSMWASTSRGSGVCVGPGALIAAQTHRCLGRRCVDGLCLELALARCGRTVGAGIEFALSQNGRPKLNISSFIYRTRLAPRSPTAEAPRGFGRSSLHFWHRRMAMRRTLQTRAAPQIPSLKFMSLPPRR